MFNEQKVIKKIQEALEDSVEGASIHVAVSGGADSMALMHLVSQMNNVATYIHHVKHNVSNNTNSWADFVKESASNMGFDVETQYVEHSLTFNSMSNFEAEARKKRYEAIFSSMNEGDILLTGHHSDDQVENVLINVFKGRGINGITSLQEKSFHSSKKIILRPLINISKNDIISHLDSKGVAFIYDESNASIDYDRNFIRNKIIPYLIKNRFKPLKQSILAVHKALTNSKVVMEELINDKINDISDDGEVNVAKFNQFTKETRTEILISILRKNNCYTYNQKVLKEIISQAENIERNGGVGQSDNLFKTKVVIKNGSEEFTIFFKKVFYGKRKEKVFYVSQT
jgi:tRNA(Ile)-lysidine synthetase-like protein